MSKTILFSILAIVSLSSVSFAPRPREASSKLSEWRKGIWLPPDGSNTIYTDTHSFVLVAGGDSASQNIYCGAS